MKKTILIKHKKGAPGLRLLGLGPNLNPCNGLQKLQQLLEKNTTWAKNRTIGDLKKNLSNSDVIISLWLKKEIVGFGRALSDGVYRAVLWDIVIDENYQGYGYGKIIVNTMLESKHLKNIEKIYLMTSNKKDFYCQLGFREVPNQDLLIKEIKA